MPKPQTETMDNFLVRDRWCGYGGHFFRGVANEFIKHLHKCEIDCCDRAYKDKLNG